MKQNEEITPADHDPSDAVVMFQHHLEGLTYNSHRIAIDSYFKHPFRCISTPKSSKFEGHSKHNKLDNYFN